LKEGVVQTIHERGRSFSFSWAIAHSNAGWLGSDEFFVPHLRYSEQNQFQAVGPCAPRHFSFAPSRVFKTNSPKSGSPGRAKRRNDTRRKRHNPAAMMMVGSSFEGPGEAELVRQAAHFPDAGAEYGVVAAASGSGGIKSVVRAIGQHRFARRKIENVPP
jgi:hypothetical protein